jgi:hypothetical protein
MDAYGGLVDTLWSALYQTIRNIPRQIIQDTFGLIHSGILWLIVPVIVALVISLAAQVSYDRKIRRSRAAQAVSTNSESRRKKPNTDVDDFLYFPFRRAYNVFKGLILAFGVLVFFISQKLGYAGLMVGFGLGLHLGQVAERAFHRSSNKENLCKLATELLRRADAGDAKAVHYAKRIVSLIDGMDVFDNVLLSSWREWYYEIAKGRRLQNLSEL